MLRKHTKTQPNNGAHKARRATLLLTILFGSLFGVTSAHAGDKFDLSLGFFDLSSGHKLSNGSTESGSSSALGVYQIEYRHGFFSKFELGLGYSLMASGTVGGSLGYGLDLDAYYYPFTFSGIQTFKEGDKYQVVSSDIWRPFVGTSFNQRTFSTSSVGFAGFGFILGTERSVTEKLSIKAEFRVLSLGGSSLTANSEELLFGASFAF